MKLTLMTSLMMTALLTLTACGDSGSGNNKVGGKGGIAWEKIPGKYNPRQEKIELSIQEIQKIEMNLFGFNGDVRVQYSDELYADKMILQLFTVNKDAKTSLSGVDASRQDEVLSLRKYGNYQCSIRMENGEISSLKGACFVKVVVTLPASAEIEVENLGRLLTKRYFAMTNARFIEKLDDASFDQDKFVVIESFLASYRAVRKTPELTANELGKVIDEFSFSDAKLRSLQTLHSYVQDRENLNDMIEDEFSSSFDQEKARRIVGIN